MVDADDHSLALMLPGVLWHYGKIMMLLELATDVFLDLSELLFCGKRLNPAHQIGKSDDFASSLPRVCAAITESK